MGTERDKMLAGELYDALDPDLVSDRYRVRGLCQKLNASRDADENLRRDLCRQIFGKGGETVWMQPPFYCDYGSNIELGERVFFNFNCVVLDVCARPGRRLHAVGPSGAGINDGHAPCGGRPCAGTQEYREAGRDRLGRVGRRLGRSILPGGDYRLAVRSIGAGSVVTRDVTGWTCLRRATRVASFGRSAPRSGRPIRCPDHFRFPPNSTLSG